MFLKALLLRGEAGSSKDLLLLTHTRDISTERVLDIYDFVVTTAPSKRDSLVPRTPRVHNSLQDFTFFLPYIFGMLSLKLEEPNRWAL